MGNVKQKTSYVGENERRSGLRGSKTIEQIKKKLVKARPKLEGNPNELHELATGLTNREEIKKRYFGHLLTRMNDAIVSVKEEKKDLSGRTLNKDTKRDFVERLDDVISSVHELKVKLVLSEVNSNPLKAHLARFFHDNFYEFKFGPFHAAIHIDNIVLEWGPDSLVIPRIVEGALHKASVDDANALLVADLHEDQEAVQAQDTFTEEAFDKTIQEVINLTKEKKCLIDELADVIVRYNTKFHYGMLSNNCQHFVVDVLSVLGITNHMEAFKGKLKSHAELLMMREDKAVAEFNNHKELDDYVHENLDKMEPEDLQFCYCTYLLFHTWEVRQPKQEAWRCTKEKCMSKTLADRLNITAT